METKICKTCGKRYSPNSSNQQNCKNCRDVYRECIVCGKKIFKKQAENWKYWKNKKFCSYRCYWKDLKGRPSKKKGIKTGYIPKSAFKKGQSPWNKGITGEDSHFWQGGLSFEPYGLEFNEDLKEVIRNRDRRKCWICEKTELENKEKLAVHHIDYDKKNNNPDNLLSLCRECHARTNTHRDFWIECLQFGRKIILVDVK